MDKQSTLPTAAEMDDLLSSVRENNRGPILFGVETPQRCKDCGRFQDETCPHISVKLIMVSGRWKPKAFDCGWEYFRRKNDPQ